MMNNDDGKIVLTRLGQAVSAATKTESHQVYLHMQSVIGSDRLMKALEAIHPGNTVFFGDKDNSPDQAPLYVKLGVSPQDIKRAIKDTGIVQSSWAHANKPLYWLLMLYIRDCAMNKKEDEAKMAVLFMATAMYAGLQFRYFRRFYQHNAMLYARNTLTDKFTLKQEGTMLKSIMAIAWKSHEKYITDIVKGTDQDFLRYLVSMWGRLNGMIKALKNHYEITKASGAYLNQSNNRYDDGEMVDHETDGGRVQMISDSMSEAFFGEAMPTRIVDLASQMAEIPKHSLALAINEIRSSDVIPIRTAIHLIVEIFFDENKASRDDIRTRLFISHALMVYTRSNTADGRIDELKKILNNLLIEHSPQYLRTNRDATKGLFRKALYLVLVLFIQSKA